MTQSIGRASQKYLYVIPTLSPGGAEHQTVNQLNYLATIGIEAHLLVFSDRLDLLEGLDIPKDRLHLTHIEGAVSLNKRGIVALPSMIRDYRSVVKLVKPDAVIAILPLAHLICRLAAYGSLRSYPKLWIYHRSMQYAANPIDTNAKKLFHAFTRHLSAKGDFGHLFISEAVKQNISEELRVRNGVVLHNAIPQRSVSPAAASTDLEKRMDRSGYRLVVVPGRLHPVKGQVFFLESILPLLKQPTANPFKVVFVGGGPDRDKLSALIARHHLHDRVIITGAVVNSLMLSYLKYADLAVIPSIHEGFGNVAVECLMTGTPVLASATGGLPEIIHHNDNGYTFRVGDSADLRKQLGHIINASSVLSPVALMADYEARFTLRAQVAALLSIVGDLPIVAEKEAA